MVVQELVPRNRNVFFDRSNRNTFLLFLKKQIELTGPGLARAWPGPGFAPHAVYTPPQPPREAWNESCDAAVAVPRRRGLREARAALSLGSDSD